MLQTIFGLYLQSLLIAVIGVFFASFCWFLWRIARRADRSLQARQDFLYDLLMINVMTIPILSFGIVGILLMLKV